MQKKLFRSKTNRKLLGVCGGIGEFFDIDPTLVRLFWIVGFFMGGLGLLAYLVAAIIIPEESDAQ